MTVLKSLAMNVLMLVIAAGVIYWALQGDISESEQAVAVIPQTADVQDVDEAGSSPEGYEAVMTAEKATSAPSAFGPRRTASPPGSVKDQAPPRRPVTFPLDLNTARFEDFLELPGIGEQLAQRLVEYRDSHGSFRSVEDLREVHGIGKKRMERLRPFVMTAVSRD